MQDQSPRELSPHAIITVNHLHKVYGTTVAVKDVSFAVREGEILGIIGPNGAGKTTTVECISGLREQDSGSVRVMGYDPQKDRTKVRERVGVQLQEGALPPRIKVGEALELFASFYDQPADVDGLLRVLGLSEKRKSYFKALSGGQKQRLSIALALIGNPKIAILDELTTGLDPQARRETWKLIEHIRDQGVTIVLVTHYMDEAERLCDRVMLINQGEVVALDTPQALAAQEGGGIHMRFRPSRPIADELLTSLPEVISVEHEGPHVAVTGTGNVLSSVENALDRAGVQATDVQVRSGSLEDAFVKLTRNTSQAKAEGSGHE